MICVSRFFDRASGHSVFVLSNCYVEQTPPLGQSDKCRDRLASASLSNLLHHAPTPWTTSHLPQSGHPSTLLCPFTWNWQLGRDAQGFVMWRLKIQTLPTPRVSKSSASSLWETKSVKTLPLSSDPGMNTLLLLLLFWWELVSWLHIYVRRGWKMRGQNEQLLSSNSSALQKSR